MQRWTREWEMCQSYMLVVICLKGFVAIISFFHRDAGLNAARFWFHAETLRVSLLSLWANHIFPYTSHTTRFTRGTGLGRTCWEFFGIARYNIIFGHGYSLSQGLPSILVICTRESSSQTWKFWTTKNARFPTWEKEEHETYGFIWFACGSMCLVRFMFHLPVPWSSGHFTWSQWPMVTFTGLSCSLGQDIEKWKIRAYPLWNPDLLKMDAWGSFIYLL